MTLGAATRETTSKKWVASSAAGVAVGTRGGLQGRIIGGLTDAPTAKPTRVFVFGEKSFPRGREISPVSRDIFMFR